MEETFMYNGHNLVLKYLPSLSGPERRKEDQVGILREIWNVLDI